MSKDFNEFRKTFIAETEEHLLILNEHLIAMEKNKKKKEHIDTIFRVLHTIKSSAAAVELNDLAGYTHTAEDLVQNIQNDKIQLDIVIIDLLFEIGDQLQQYINMVKKKQESVIDLDPAIDKINKINSEWHVNKTKSTRITKSVKQQEKFRLTKKHKALISREKKKGEICYAIGFEIDPQEQIKGLRARLITNHLKDFSQLVACFPDEKTIMSKIFDGRFSLILLTNKKSAQIKKMVDVDLIKTFQIHKVIDTGKFIRLVKKTEIQEVSAESKEVNEGNSSGMDPLSTSQTIRIPVKRLDNLLHLVGELAIINSGLKIQEKKLQDLSGAGDIYHEMNLLTDNLIKISSDLQNGVMKARMIPVSMLFNQFKRIVRDLSRKENKDIDLIIQGGETELDKNVIDTICDPLMHMVRNAVDHGIETSKERRKKGKSDRGIVTLSAAQSGNHIIISLQDDGQGIDIDKVKDFALQKGLMDEDHIDEIGTAEIIKYIFEPGFTTTRKVSAVSGRGIGLDVVKTGIKSLNGSIQVSTDSGKGTEFRIILPLTLAITTVVVVESNANLYAVPILDIQESIKIKPSDINDKECVKVIQYRDEVLPVINLRDLFQKEDGISENKGNEYIPVLVIRVMNNKVGIMVDRVLSKQDVMLKPLETHYRSVKGISGAAVLGDGRIILVLDTLQVLSDFIDKKQVTSMELKSSVS